MICETCHRSALMVFSTRKGQQCGDCRAAASVPRPLPKSYHSQRPGFTALRTRQYLRTMNNFVRRETCKGKEGAEIAPKELARRFGVAPCYIEAAMVHPQCPLFTARRAPSGHVIALRSNATFASFLIAYLKSSLYPASK